MDAVFFENLLRYLSDVTEKKVGMSLMQIMSMQYVSDHLPLYVSFLTYLPVPVKR
jgi:hypothetical protein